jgi:hypothetical protein
MRKFAHGIDIPTLALLLMAAAAPALPQTAAAP